MDNGGIDPRHDSYFDRERTISIEQQLKESHKRVEGLEKIIKVYDDIIIYASEQAKKDNFMLNLITEKAKQLKEDAELGKALRYAFDDGLYIKENCERIDKVEDFMYWYKQQLEKEDLKMCNECPNPRVDETCGNCEQTEKDRG